MTCHSGTCVWRAAKSCPLRGGTPPRQGTHVLAARDDMATSCVTLQDERAARWDAKKVTALAHLGTHALDSEQNGEFWHSWLDPQLAQLCRFASCLIGQ